MIAQKHSSEKLRKTGTGPSKDQLLQDAQLTQQSLH